MIDDTSKRFVIRGEVWGKINENDNINNYDTIENKIQKPINHTKLEILEMIIAIRLKLDKRGVKK